MRWSHFGVLQRNMQFAQPWEIAWPFPSEPNQLLCESDRRPCGIYKDVMQLFSDFGVLNSTRVYECDKTECPLDATRNRAGMPDSGCSPRFVGASRRGAERAAVSFLQFARLYPPSQVVRRVRSISPRKLFVHVR